MISSAPTSFTLTVTTPSSMKRKRLLGDDMPEQKSALTFRQGLLDVSYIIGITNRTDIHTPHRHFEKVSSDLCVRFCAPDSGRVNVRVSVTLRVHRNEVADNILLYALVTEQNRLIDYSNRVVAVLGQCTEHTRLRISYNVDQSGLIPGFPYVWFVGHACTKASISSTLCDADDNAMFPCMEVFAADGGASFHHTS